MNKQKMNVDKRRFLTAAALGGAALPALALTAGKRGAARGPTLLTVTGAIGRGNRRAFDPALDQLMKKHGVKFDNAHAFDFDAVGALPAVTIKPTLEYDAKPHLLRGPLLSDVIKAAGANDADKVLLRAIDGYAVLVSLADVRKYHFIVATAIDGAPMPLGGLGPLWAVYDADRFPDMAAKPLNQRFGLCPWALYHIDVQQA